MGRNLTAMTEPSMIPIGYKISIIRKYLGETQEAFSEKLRISRSSLIKLEKETNNLRIGEDILYRIYYATKNFLCINECTEPLERTIASLVRSTEKDIIDTIESINNKRA